MKIHVTTLVELNEGERAVLREAGNRWARSRSGCDRRTGRIKRVAGGLKIGPETLRCWENGSRRPSWAMLERWCALVGVDQIDLRLAPTR